MAQVTGALRFIFAVGRLCAAAVATVLLILFAVHPEPQVARFPACPTAVGQAVVDLCNPQEGPVPLNVFGALPECTPQQLALLPPGFEPVNCRRPL